VKVRRYGEDDPRQRAHARYREWHRTLGRSALAFDVDFVEVRARDGELLPVAIIETTSVRDAALLDDGEYVGQILKRLRSGGQMRVLRRLAHAVGARCYVVIYDWRLTAFGVWDEDREFLSRFDEAGYREWLLSLGRRS
jgi:hypothetical protein